MNTNKRIMRSITAGIIVLFFSINIIPYTEAGNIVTKNDNCTEKTSADNDKIPNLLNTPSPSITIKGTKGKNYWFITCVNIIFTKDPATDEIWYHIDEGNFQQYSTPINYCEDGFHNILWYWLDFFGGQHNESSVFFKIDQTPPTITLAKKIAIGGKVTFTATVNDDASGVEYVEFYLDDVLQENLTEAPYKWTWEGTEAHMVYAIGYNGAGLSEKSDTLSTPRSLSYDSQFIYRLLQKIFNIIF